jgi:hypothetical protein
MTSNLNDSEFYAQYRGSFSSILKWPQLDEFWQQLKNTSMQNWYIYAPGAVIPEEPASREELELFITEIDALLRKEHQEEYCGVVYVDDKQNPSFIKIYDPNNLGVVCGFSDNPPLPGWIMTTTKPLPLDEKTFITAARKRWWQRLFPN